MKKTNFLFEVSWEVCNKVGGIYTVIRSKIPQAVKHFDQNYILVGPWLEQDTPDFKEEHNPAVANMQHILENVGIDSRIGFWKVGNLQVRTILIKNRMSDNINDLLFQLWEDFGVDSMHGSNDYKESVVFGNLAGRAIAALSEFYEDYNILAHFHEWMTGSGVLYLKKHEPRITTIFTTHATVLGRSMAGNGVELYEKLDQVNATSEAQNFNVSAKHSLEKTSAREADCFTTVSDITSSEAQYLLGVPTAATLPNGFDQSLVPDYHKNKEYYTGNRNKLLEFANRFLNKSFNSESTLIVCNSGRYEFRNKGIDLILDALAKIPMHESKKDLLFYFFVLAGSPEVSTGESKSPIRYSDMATHPLWQPASDPIINTSHKLNLLNPDSRLNIIFVPVYLNGHDGALNMEYYEALSGCDLSLFPSYYEPWGYTPMESISYAVPTVSSNYAGFGQWVQSLKQDTPGIHILERKQLNFEQVSKNLSDILINYLNKPTQELNEEKKFVQQVAQKTDWAHFYQAYIKAYQFAKSNCNNRLKGLMESKQKSNEINFRGADSNRPRLRQLTIKSAVPKKLAGLRDLAYNLWYSYTPQAHNVFSHLDPVLYDKIGNNPVSLIESIPESRFKEAIKSENYMTLFENVSKKIKKYLEDTSQLIDTSDSIGSKNPVAYFSMEFGFHESLPIYSGGLGILSGDHIKSASDVNLPLIGIGLLYKNGYFKQGIAQDGSQKAVDFVNDFYRMPLIEVKKNNKALIISIDVPSRTIFAKVWCAQVGRVKVYLLDTNILQNNPADRGITAHLYGGGKKTRIEQEIILGIGGIKMLQELNITPSVYHMNEGHSALLIVQRMINQIKYNKLSFDAAREVIKASTVFTTHTPVPAGNEVFEYELVETYLKEYVEKNGLSWELFNELSHRSGNESGKYEMTVLALTNSTKRNGVSKLHGAVSRKMWMGLWPSLLEEEIPIGSITNGVHQGTWLSTPMRNLFVKHFAVDFQEELLDKDFWDKIDLIPDNELWHTHINMKSRFFDLIKSKVSKNWMREGEDPNLLDQFLLQLNPGPLTIGFARRFATYKRATLLFKDFERFKRIVLNTKYPVQFVFAGKAHPDDVMGQNLIKEIVAISKQKEFLGKVVFLEDYDITLARKMVSSVDVWLNNPIRPNEASGTSGMKAGMNGVLNCSILDGWWDEGFDGQNGWSFGEQKEFKNIESQNIFDSDSFYEVLENNIIPLYYSRNTNGIPEKWIRFMKHSIKTIIPDFNTHRMLRDYIEQMYAPASKQFARLSANNFEMANQLAEWKKSVQSRFSSLHIENIKITGSKGDALNVNDEISFEIELDKGKLAENEIKVQAILIRDLSADSILYEENGIYHNDNITYIDLDLKESKEHKLMFANTYKAKQAGKFQFGIRVMPYHASAFNAEDLNLVIWA